MKMMIPKLLDLLPWMPGELPTAAISGAVRVYDDNTDDLFIRPTNDDMQGQNGWYLRTELHL